MLVKFDPPLGELYWAIDKQKPQDYHSFGIISKPKANQKPTPKALGIPTSIDSEPAHPLSRLRGGGEIPDLLQGPGR